MVPFIGADASQQGARQAQLVAGARLVAERENVVMTRTFSKIHGLAALRLGWAFAPAHVVDVIRQAVTLALSELNEQL